MLLIGSTCYTKDNFSGNFIQGVITMIVDGHCIIECQSVVSRNGAEVFSFHGTSGARIEKVFATIGEAVAHADQESAKNIENYLHEMQTVKDLLRFPLDHCLGGEEYIDQDAVEAYKLRILSLFGFPISDR